jgi:hypothetical protein
MGRQSQIDSKRDGADLFAHVTGPEQYPCMSLELARWGSVGDRLDEVVNDPLEGASILSLAQARRDLGAAHPSLPADSTSQWGSQ